MLKSILLSGAALVLASSAFAQDESAPDESVIVSATRVPTPAAQVASSVTLINAGEIDARQQRSLPDVLALVPGLAVVQSGGEGGQTSLFMRGTNSDHTKILLDGIDISDPSSSTSADIGKLLTGDIARVDVLRGPQSGLYGSDAIGGVIDIVTKDGEGPATITGSAESGSFDTFNQTAHLSGADDNFHYTATLDHEHAGATPVTPLNLLLPGEARNDDYFDGVNASTKLGLDLSSNVDLGLVGLYSESLGRITTDAFNPVTFASYPGPTQARIVTLQNQTRGTVHGNFGGIDQTLGLAYGDTITSTQDPNNGPSRSQGNRVKLDWQGNAALMEGETIVVGAETARDAIHAPLSAGVTTNAVYGELQSALGRNFFNSATIRYDDNSRFGGQTTWRLAPTLLLDGTKLKASIGSGFKAPSLEDLFQNFPSFGFFANPNLKPETSIGYDAGVEQDFAGLGAEGVSGGITYFHNAIHNLINDNASFTMDVNIGKAMTQGVEAFAAWKASDSLSLRADYTYTDAIDEVAHLELLRRPRNKASLTADWQAMTALSLDASLIYTGPQIDGNRSFSIPRLKMPGYTVANIAANWRVDDTFTLFGRIDNAFDTNYQSPDGFLRPGIGVYAGVKASL